MVMQRERGGQFHYSFYRAEEGSKGNIVEKNQSIREVKKVGLEPARIKDLAQRFVQEFQNKLVRSVYSGQWFSQFQNELLMAFYTLPSSEVNKICTQINRALQEVAQAHPYFSTPEKRRSLAEEFELHVSGIRYIHERVLPDRKKRFSGGKEKTQFFGINAELDATHSIDLIEFTLDPATPVIPEVFLIQAKKTAVNPPEIEEIQRAHQEYVKQLFSSDAIETRERFLAEVREQEETYRNTIGSLTQGDEFLVNAHLTLCATYEDVIGRINSEGAEDVFESVDMSTRITTTSFFRSNVFRNLRPMFEDFFGSEEMSAVVAYMEKSTPSLAELKEFQKDKNIPIRALSINSCTSVIYSAQAAPIEKRITVGSRQII